MKLTRYTDPAGEWPALYVDGILDKDGDHSIIDERISILAGVEDHVSDAFLRGGRTRDDVAPRLDDIREYEQDKATAREEAVALRVQADALLERAQKLDEGN